MNIVLMVHVGVSIVSLILCVDAGLKKSRISRLLVLSAASSFISGFALIFAGGSLGRFCISAAALASGMLFVQYNAANKNTLKNSIASTLKHTNKNRNDQ